MADQDPIAEEIARAGKGAGTAVAEPEDDISAEIKKAAKKQTDEETYPVAPLEGTTVGAFPSPASRYALPEGPPDLGPPDHPKVSAPTPVPAPSTPKPSALKETIAGPGTFFGTPDVAGFKAMNAAPILSAAPAVAALERMKVPNEPPVVAGGRKIVEGTLGAVQGFLTPKNLELIGTMEALPGIAGMLAGKAKALYAAADGFIEDEEWEKAAAALKAAKGITWGNNTLKALNVGASGYFTTQFASALYDDSKKMKKAVDSKDWESAAEIMGEAVPNMVFTALGAKDAIEAGGRVKAGIQERSAARAGARADSGLPGEAPSPAPQVVPPETVPEDLKQATPEAQAAPAEPEAAAKPSQPKRTRRAPVAPVVPEEPPAEAPVERRETAGESPTGVERRSVKDIQGPPSNAVIQDAKARLEEPDLTEPERTALEARVASLEEHPEDVEALRGEDLGRIREEGKEPADEISREIQAASKPSEAEEPEEEESADREAISEPVSREAVPEDIEPPEDRNALLTHVPREGTIDDAVHRSMYSMAGAADRIRKVQQNGATDAQIKSLASYSFGSRGGMTIPGGSVDYKGGDNPQVKIEHYAGPITTIKGAPLIQKIRDLYGITTPGNQVTSKTSEEPKVKWTTARIIPTRAGVIAEPYEDKTEPETVMEKAPPGGWTEADKVPKTPEAEATRRAGHIAALPRDLAGSKPRYGYRENNYALDFESPTDKALYTVAQPTKNKAHDRFMSYLKAEFPERSENEIVAMGQKVRAAIKPLAAADGGESDTLTVPKQDFGERGSRNLLQSLQRRKSGPLTNSKKGVLYPQRSKRVGSQPSPLVDKSPSLEHVPDHWVEQTKEHWKQFRPKMYADLQAKGVLHQRAVKAASQTSDDVLNAVNQGQDYQSAWEENRQRYMFLPSEDDQPDLATDKSPQEIKQATTTTSPKRTPSAPEASAQNTETTFPPLEP